MAVRPAGAGRGRGQERRQTLASVNAGRALVRTAQLNLGYTTITSPINGVMGRAQFAPGGAW